MFKAYEGKPVTRMAHEVTAEDVIEKVGEATSTINGVEFKHYEPVNVGDYIVRLTEDDTYHCTKAVFEERNYITQKTTGLTFSEAIAASKNGHKISRPSWNGKGMFVVYMSGLKLPPYNTADTSRKVNDRTAKWIGEDQELDSQPYCAMYNAQKQWIPGWHPQNSDFLTDDWMIVE